MTSNAVRITEDRGYDLARYEQTTAPRPRLEVRTNRRYHSRFSGIWLLSCCVLMVMMISLAIFNNAAMVVMGDRISDANDELGALTQRAELLSAKLESGLTGPQLEIYARETLGMGSCEQYQVTLLELKNEDSIVRTERAPDKSIRSRAGGKLMELLDTISESINIK